MKPISRTAFACCSVRMHDAESDRPICGDHFARRFMESEEGRRVLDAFQGMKGGDRSSAGNVARHRIIDDVLRQELTRARDLLVVTVGAGFDSRPYRLQGGTWVELDEPQVLAFKDERLPVAECPNALHRVAIDFARESLEEKLGPWASRAPAAIVVEGVLLYLEEAQIRQLLRGLCALFPRHILVCELLTRRFVETYGKTTREAINQLGATFKYTVDRPEGLFLREGYRLRDRISIGMRAVELGAMKIPFGIPRFLARALMRNAVNGYTVCVFEAEG